MLEKTKKIIKRVAIFGDADLKSDDEAYIKAKETAKLLVESGYIIVNGGGPGIMGAATEGAKEADGVVELVVMDPEKEPDNYEGIDKENFAYASKVYYTDTYEHRLDKLMEIADAYVIFKGGTGTLSEVGMVWEQAKFEYGNHEPLVFVGKEWREIVETLQKNMNYQNIEKRVVATVETADEVIKALKQVEN
jgi:uncharacterized protein (TIGR00730 family)